MKLRRQPRPARGGARSAPRARRAAKPSRSGRRGAARPGVPLLRRVASVLPSLGRSLAVLLTVGAGAATVALVNGPWLPVTEIAYAGNRHTDAALVDRLLAESRGASVLSVSTAGLAERLEALPAVDSVDISLTTTGRLEANVTEKPVAIVWQAAARRFLAAADGTVLAAVPDGQALPSALAGVPQLHDDRFVARLVSEGDVIPQRIVSTAIHLARLDPAVLGSAATHLSLRLDDEFGFRLVSIAPAWEIALGAYGIDPEETAADEAARLERQAAAVRTLFAERPEAEIGWIDVRNPGKVYFRAKG